MRSIPKDGLVSYYPESILQLIDSIGKLPGVGAKTAERLALHLLKMPIADVEAFANDITHMRKNVRLCSHCFGLSDGQVCSICSDVKRDKSRLCVVEKPGDMVSMEKAGAFRGLYHILMGALNPIGGVGPERLKINELVERIKQSGITEVVLATSTTVEGEATASYLAELLQNKFPELSITRIACGIPMGGDLKYVDEVTLKRAMEARAEYK